MIDFEYGGPNYLAYDIANHFCEFAGGYNLIHVYRISSKNSA